MRRDDYIATYIRLERADLVDLGVNKNICIHQTRLLKLIDGSVSARKYEDGGYMHSYMDP